MPANDQVCSMRLDIVKFVSDSYPCQWSGVFDTSWYSKDRQWQIFLPMIRCVRSNTPDHWQGYLSLTKFTISRRIEHTWSLAGISVTDELYYIKTYRTHLIIGRDICHWRNDQMCSIRLDIVKVISDRYPCQWSGVFETSWYSKVRQWQISLPMFRCVRYVLI
jgi:hypothetical protein